LTLNFPFWSHFNKLFSFGAAFLPAFYKLFSQLILTPVWDVVGVTMNPKQDPKKTKKTKTWVRVLLIIIKTR
jgi:hypothetical protein